VKTLRSILAVAIVAVVTATLCAAATPLTFQPEVLLMKTADKGADRSFAYAKLKPVAIAGKENQAVFRYRADIDVVSVTITAKAPDASGVVTATVFTQRKRTLPDGNDETTNQTGIYKFTPGKSLIVDNRPRMMANNIDANVEMLQLTLEK
jgi:hypothetical protein